MKSFSVLSAFLLVCLFALVQVWAAPVEAEVAETNEVANSAVAPATEDQAYLDWYNAAARQYAKALFTRDAPPPFPPFPPFPPPPTFPPFPPPPTFPPFPPFPPGRGW